MVVAAIVGALAIAAVAEVTKPLDGQFRSSMSPVDLDVPPVDIRVSGPMVESDVGDIDIIPASAFVPGNDSTLNVGLAAIALAALLASIDALIAWPTRTRRVGERL